MTTMAEALHVAGASAAADFRDSMEGPAASRSPRAGPGGAEGPRPAERPYISIVATSRNDDHGGDMLRRMQIFVDSWIQQARRFRLQSELVIVEWNPPPERPPLSMALRWADDEGYCPVRIVTVPPALHATLPHSDALPLFQMIAKNVGIRRARGEYVLATNVDLLFSDPLMRFLAERRLAPGRFYRSDRVDVDRDVPLEASVEEKLKYCRTHVLRVNRADGIRLVPQDGKSHRAEEAQIDPRDVFLPPGLAGVGTRARRWLRSTERGRAWYASDLVREPVRAVWRGFVQASRMAGLLRRWLGDLASGPAGAARALSRTRATEAWDEIVAPFRRCPAVHTVACGDFTLMSARDWMRCDGNPELPYYSFHLDSLALYEARGAGIREARLPPDCVHYHIEHGGGFTPEGERAMYDRWRSRGVPVMSHGELVRRGQLALLSPARGRRRAGWGFGDEELPETTIRRGAPVT